MAHPIPSSKIPPIARLREIMHILRAPGGCPWDAEQTHESLVKHLIEEAYEVAEAIAGGDRNAIVDELGDLLLQPVFHGEIGSETGSFDLDDVASAICDKLIRRHPHVFGDASLEDSDAVLTQWEKIKATEKSEGENSRERFISKANDGLPGLMASQKLQKKASEVGFDWPDLKPVIAKIYEELEEVKEAISEKTSIEIGEEIGDLLFAVVNLARKTGHEAELLIHQTNRKFVSRFHEVEDRLIESGKTLEEATLEEMDQAWDAAKVREKAEK